jgi:hypothetical protein
MKKTDTIPDPARCRALPCFAEVTLSVRDESRKGKRGRGQLDLDGGEPLRDNDLNWRISETFHIETPGVGPGRGGGQAEGTRRIGLRRHENPVIGSEFNARSRDPSAGRFTNDALNFVDPYAGGREA